MMMAFDLDPERMQIVLNKNLATSYGLTLVVGLPFPLPILERVARLREQIETLLPRRLVWYEPHHLHATLAAPLRGRYREGPPLQRDELPPDLDGLVEVLNGCFSALSPFVLRLDELGLAPDGRLLALGADPAQVRRQVASRLASVPGLDRPKALGGESANERTANQRMANGREAWRVAAKRGGMDGWHVTLGYLQMPDVARQESFEAGWAALQPGSLGAVTVDRVWLVHYADRTLGRVAGKVSFMLGRPNALTTDSLLRDLGIGQAE